MATDFERGSVGYCVCPAGKAVKPGVKEIKKSDGVNCFVTFLLQINENKL